jgi:hypothetical protein
MRDAPGSTRTIHTAAAAALVAALTACTGDIVGTATTDFGVAVATSERTEVGDIEGWLTNPAGDQLYGELGWSASDGTLQAWVAGQSIPVQGVMHLDDQSLEALNLMLFTLWEIEIQDLAPYCTSNELVLCCRDDGWRCRASAP